MEKHISVKHVFFCATTTMTIAKTIQRADISETYE